jgi:hypothetical protein
MDGLRVPFIVYDPSEPVEYDHDEIITVSGIIQARSFQFQCKLNSIT